MMSGWLTIEYRLRQHLIRVLKNIELIQLFLGYVVGKRQTGKRFTIAL